MTPEDGARALYEAGHLFQLEEVARILELPQWLELLEAHKRCARAAQGMKDSQKERLSMEREDGELHAAEIEEQSALIHLLCAMFHADVMQPGPGYRGVLQVEMYQAARIHARCVQLCPEYLP